MRCRPLPRSGAAPILALSALAVTSCSASTTRMSLPPTSPVVTVTMHEYSFSIAGHPRPGRTVFRFVNAGRETHGPMLVEVGLGAGPVEQEVRKPSPPPFKRLGLVNGRQPGNTGTFAVQLEPNTRYALICRARAADGVPHAQKGMTWEVRTQSSSSGT